MVGARPSSAKRLHLYKVRFKGQVEQVITLTTDFGTRDGFVAQMKGVLLGINPRVRLVDVTHHIEPFSILEGALVLRSLSTYFPPRTIHLGVVDPGVGGKRRAVVLAAGEQFYVGPDNGLFSLVFRSHLLWKMREIRSKDYMLPDPHPTFHGRDLFAPTAAYLSVGKPFESVGPEVNDPVILPVPEVKRTEGGLDGEVIYVDRFGNLTTNIETQMLDRPVARVQIGGMQIDGLSFFYDQVPEGSPLAVVNSFGYLEIAVNRGDAAKYFRIGKGEQVLVILGSPQDVTVRPGFK